MPTWAGSLQSDRSKSLIVLIKAAQRAVARGQLQSAARVLVEEWEPRDLGGGPCVPCGRSLAWTLMLQKQIHRV
jgi:hypothetical protein